MHTAPGRAGGGMAAGAAALGRTRMRTGRRPPPPKERAVHNRPQRALARRRPGAQLHEFLLKRAHRWEGAPQSAGHCPPAAPGLPGSPGGNGRTRIEFKETGAPRGETAEARLFLRILSCGMRPGRVRGRFSQIRVLVPDSPGICANI
eukprot:gene11277-biopygen16854